MRFVVKFNLSFWGRGYTRRILDSDILINLRKNEQQRLTSDCNKIKKNVTFNERKINITIILTKEKHIQYFIVLFFSFIIRPLCLLPYYESSFIFDDPGSNFKSFVGISTQFVSLSMQIIAQLSFL